MPGHGVAPVQARLAVVTAAASHIPAPRREAGVATRIPVPQRLLDATETPTLAAAPAQAVMVTAEAATAEPIRLEATAATTTADAMAAGDSMQLRSADRMARLTQRAFIVVVGESHATLAWRGLSDFGDRRLITYRSRGPVPTMVHALALPPLGLRTSLCLGAYRLPPCPVL